MASDQRSPADRGISLVQGGYDAIGGEYAAERRLGACEIALLDEFSRLLPEGASVLDAGCGAGIPIARRLSGRFAVTGVDISEKQIERARSNVPAGTFICANMSDLDFPEASFDGICSFYAIIHTPREKHAEILPRFHQLLRPEGVVLLCLGAGNLKDDFDEFLGIPMYWSHFDAETNLAMVRDAGFQLLHSELVPDDYDPGGSARHLFVLATADKFDH